MTKKSKEIKLTAKQEWMLSNAVEKALMDGWKGSMESNIRPLATGKYGKLDHNSRKKFIVGEYIDYNNYLTEKGIKIAEENYKILSGKTFKQVIADRRKYEKAALRKRREKDKKLKDAIGNITIKGNISMNAGKRNISLYKCIINNKWFSPTHEQWIEIGKQINK